MKKPHTKHLVALACGSALCAMITACTSTPSPEVQPSDSELAMKPDNPFAQERWSTPFGAPPFDRIKTEHFAPAFEQAFAAHNDEIKAITASTEAPSFANTVEALERSGRLLERVAMVFFQVCGTDNTPELQALQEKLAPRLSRHQDEVLMNQELFARVQGVYKQRQQLDLDPSQLKLLEDLYLRFQRSGAELKGAEQQRLKAINASLAELHTQFGDRIRKENAKYLLLIDNKDDLAGLPDSVVTTAASLAEGKGHKGQWGFNLTRSSVNPFLQYSAQRELRRQIYLAYIKRGANGDELDTRPLIKEILPLRAERAQLLGYPDHAHYAISRNMAKTPQAVMDHLLKLYKPALERAKKERDELTVMLQKDLGPKAKLEPWDWRYYAEKLRQQKYALEEEQLRPYFRVDRVRDGAFKTATRLFGVTFTDVTDQVPRYHPQAQAFAVKDAKGDHVGLLYLDLHPRDSKRGGAWMEEFRGQQSLDGEVRPIVINVGNFSPPTDEGPSLLTWDNVNTLFHEFGHGMHGLLSQVRYPSQAGTRVKLDYVELPSQVMENWASHPEVIKDYARHYKTDEPIPDELVARIQQAQTFNQGFAMTEHLAAAILDQRWHSLTREQLAELSSVEAFDKKVMQEIGQIPEVEPRYHSPYFGHVFSGDYYSAGYYVYSWAMVLDADAFAAFEQSGDVFNPEMAQKFYRHVYSAGGALDEMEQYRAFRGQEPSVEPVLKKLGLQGAGEDG